MKLYHILFIHGKLWSFFLYYLCIISDNQWSDHFFFQKRQKSKIDMLTFNDVIPWNKLSKKSPYVFLISLLICFARFVVVQSFNALRNKKHFRIWRVKRSIYTVQIWLSEVHMFLKLSDSKTSNNQNFG